MNKSVSLFVILWACGGDPGDGDAVPPPTITTTQLDSAITGESYATWLEAEGGAEPLRWELEGELPDGLVFNPAGAISGVPSQPDDVDVTVTVTDDRGRSDSAEVSLAVALALNAIPCGGRVQGEFTSGASLGWYEVDWAEDAGYTWLQIPLPGDDTTRIDIEVEGYGGFFDAYLASPGTPLGDQDLSDNYRLYDVGFTGYGLSIDLGTAYDLPTYESFGDAINLLLVSEDARPWSAQAVCTNGPIFESLRFYPVGLGEEFLVNFNLVQNNADSRIWTDDPLPDWISWDEETGRLTGVAGEPGSAIFDVHAEDIDGKTRTERAGFGVYETHVLACDESFVWTPDRGYYESGDPLSSYYDVDAYRVFQTEVDPIYSMVTAHLDGFVGGEVGFATGVPYYLSSPSDGSWNSSDFAADLSAQTWPSLSAFSSGTVNAVGYSYFGVNDEATFWFECDPSPRPDAQALPVLQPDEVATRTLDVLGGVAPYTWSAQGLPAGVSLDASGELDVDQPVEGSYDVTLSVTDDQGLSNDVDFELFVGDEAACRGYPQLACGGAESGTFTGAWYNDLIGGTATFCMDTSISTYERLVVTLTAGPDSDSLVTYSDPGRDPMDVFSSFSLMAVAFAQDEEISVGVLEGLSAYEDQVLFLTAAAWEPGDWSFEVTCE